ncbi:uncharacterized protein A4U43_C08F8880 [Asparagus officinalis]|nr:uncharacterized protein A4U43_C08F8880 [Asparagus officinalis]
MIADIHRGLRQMICTFTQEGSKPSAVIQTAKVELPYAYLMAWFAQQLGYDQIYVGNPSLGLRTRGGLVDANESVVVKPIAELTAEAIARIATQMVYEAEHQKRKGKELVGPSTDKEQEDDPFFFEEECSDADRSFYR